ncbi:MAG: sigma-70 family RNA polymerase sigma factor [Candidatus Omnitrophota bacterium]
MNDISRDIIERSARGDTGAFEEIYKAFSSFVFSVSRRILRNNADAEDATQDVFIKIYRNMKRFQFKSSFKTWVYRIAVNASINTYRRKAKITRKSADFDIAVKTHGVSPGADKLIERADNELLIQSLLAGLSPEHKACILLREMEGLSYEEIAEVLKININTVRSRLKRAREALVAQKGVVKNEV